MPIPEHCTCTADEKKYTREGRSMCHDCWNISTHESGLRKHDDTPAFRASLEVSRESIVSRIGSGATTTSGTTTTGTGPGSS